MTPKPKDTQISEGDEITIAGVYDDHLRTKLSQYIAGKTVNAHGVITISLVNKDPKMRNRMPYYDDAKNAAKCAPHPFPNGYPKGWNKLGAFAPAFFKPA